MPKYTEASLQAAMASVRAGSTIRKAAAAFSVPRATLADRMKGRGTHRMAMVGSQKLSPQQETWLAQWAIAQENLGIPVSYEDIKHLGNKALKAAGSTDTLGKHWIGHFLERNPEVKRVREARVAAVAARKEGSQASSSVPGTEGEPRFEVVDSEEVQSTVEE
jgi:hypothetical protein